MKLHSSKTDCMIKGVELVNSKLQLVFLSSQDTELERDIPAEFSGKLHRMESENEVQEGK